MKLLSLAAVGAASPAAASAWAQGWMGSGTGNGSGRVRRARDILDERYARGEIDREEYLRRRDYMAGRS